VIYGNQKKELVIVYKLNRLSGILTRSIAVSENI